MNTPIVDFVNGYRDKGALRLHMPGHKGQPFLGVEDRDITEIAGADELYNARGVIRESEQSAARLFGAGDTFYSTEGSSLCVRAMVYLALLDAKEKGRRPMILAGRNAHRSFLSALALLDAEVEWLWPREEDSLISCYVDENGLKKALSSLKAPPAAVYITTPDYLGNLVDVAALSRVCREAGTPLLVDNAHGAYLKFLPKDQHPLSLGADLCCDSAHKTLPVLTGGAYLHVGKSAPDTFAQNTQRALSLFASSSPSYLILQSLDLCNAYLSSLYREKLSASCQRVSRVKEALRRYGYPLIGDEPMKITVSARPFGYTGNELHDLLRRENMECEFSDPDFLTAMFTPESGDAMEAFRDALLRIPRRDALPPPPPLPHPRREISARRALLSPCREIAVSNAVGHVLSDAQVGCPPCIPIIASGEIIDEGAARCFRYYGVETCRVVLDGAE